MALPVLMTSFNYERMQAAGWLTGILPGLEKIHGDNKDLAASNESQQQGSTIPTILGYFCYGCSHEQNKLDIPTIRAVAFLQWALWAAW